MTSFSLDDATDEDAAAVCVLALNRTYAVCSSLVSFYAPCVVMTSLYGRLYLLARQHARDIRRTLVILPQVSLLLYHHVESVLLNFP